MALQYPSFNVPTVRSPLDGVLEAFDAGRKERQEADAADAFASIYGASGTTKPKSRNFLMDLLGMGREEPAASPNTGTAGKPSDNLMSLAGFAAPQSSGAPSQARPAGSVVGQSHAAVLGAQDPALSAFFTERSAPPDPRASDLTQQAMRYFIGRGYKPHQAAGIVGNLMQESQLNVGAINPGDGNDGSDSIGIAQWNGPRAIAFRNFAQTNGLDANALNTQLAFIDHELNTTETSARDGLMAATDPIKAAMAFTGFERPQGWTAEEPWNSHGWGNRAQQAAALAGMPYDMPQAGAMPQTSGATPHGLPQPTGPSGGNLPPADVMRALFASEATRPIAIALAKASIEGQQLPQYTTFTGDDGSLMQLNTQTGQVSVVRQGQNQNQTASIQEYEYYRGQEEAAGRTPRPFGEWQAAAQPAPTVSTQPIWVDNGQGQIVPAQMSSDGSLRLTQLPEGVTPLDPATMAGERSRSGAIGTATGGTYFDLPQAELTMNQTLKAIDALRVLPDPSNPSAPIHPGADETFGMFAGVVPQQWFGAAPGTAKKDFEVAREQLQGKVFLQAFGMLRGGGAITEVEGLKAEQALAKLNTAQTREAFQEGLDEFYQAVQDGYAKLQQQAGTSVVPRPQSPPAIPQPSAATPGGTTANGLNWSVN